MEEMITSSLNTHTTPPKHTLFTSSYTTIQQINTQTNRLASMHKNQSNNHEFESKSLETKVPCEIGPLVRARDYED